MHFSTGSSNSKEEEEEEEPSGSVLPIWHTLFLSSYVCLQYDYTPLQPTTIITESVTFQLPNNCKQMAQLMMVVMVVMVLVMFW